MWTTIVSALVMVGFIFLARFLFGQSAAAGDGGMGPAMLGYGFVLLAGVAAAIVVYKAAIFGLEG